MENRELAALIERSVASAIGNYNGDLADARAANLNAYFGQPYGNEVEGESQVVSTDVFDTVEGMLPGLLKIFTTSDDAVVFNPNGPEDDEAAQQRTDVCNYVFYRQNNGFLILYEWFKDALIQMNGVVKYWWEDKETTTKESYQGLSEAQYQKFLQDKDVEVLKHSEYQDEDAAEEKAQGLKMALAQIDQKAQQLGPQVDLLKARITQQFAQMPVPNLHDVELRVTKDVSKVCIETVPPEEFGISAEHKCVSIQDADFCYHKTKKSVSYLRENGCPEDIILRIGSASDSMDLTPESLARSRFIDETRIADVGGDDSMRDVWVTDCFIRMDFDGDGVAELRHIIKAGSEIWTNDEADHINFAALTPIIMPHRFIGRSVSELVMPDQFTKTVILRQMLNNLYLTNNPRKAVLSSSSGVMQANLDDLMVSRAGAIMREYTPGAIRNEETPFVAGAAFPMLEYIDGQKEVRTGQTRYSQGTDADSLNKTARGINLIQQAGQQRLDLIARVFAETGVKDLFKGIAHLLSKYNTKPMTIRLRNQWVDVDPRDWKTQFDMIVNVGLGTGNKDIQLQHLAVMGESQLELMKEGKGYLVTDENVYNLHKKRAEAMGFKHPEIFISDPKSVQKPPPAPNPDMLKVQQADAEVKAKIASNERIRLFDAQTQKEIEAIKQQGAQMLKRMEMQAHHETEAMKIGHDAQVTVFKENSDLAKTQQANEIDQLQTQMEQAQMKMEFTKQLLAMRKEIDTVLKADMDGTEAGVPSLSNQLQTVHEQSTQQTTQAIDRSMQMIAGELGKLGQILTAMQQIGQQQLKLQSESRDLLLNPPPRNVQLGNIQKNAAGEITGASVTPTLQ